MGVHALGGPVGGWVLAGCDPVFGGVAPEVDAFAHGFALVGLFGSGVLLRLPAGVVLFHGDDGGCWAVVPGRFLVVVLGGVALP